MLTHPVHFICREDRVWPELRSDDHVPITDARLAEICIDSLDTWIQRTAYELRKRGASVTVSRSVRADCINVADMRELGRRNRGLTSFLLVPRGDGHDPRLANFALVQNGVARSALPHDRIRMWLQPGIRPRDPARGTRIERLSYKGAIWNLDAAFRAPRFREMLAAEGVTFEVGSEKVREAGSHWADYRNDDLILAVRNLTRYDAEGKPASKLVNAWHAGVPALLGPEPAFAEIGQRGRDWIEVRTPEDVLAWVRTLRADPGRYERMVAAGHAQAAIHDDEENAARWIALLNGPVARAFEAWQRKPAVLRAATVLRKFIEEPRNRATHRARVADGPRILDRQDTPHMPALAI